MDFTRQLFRSLAENDLQPLIKVLEMLPALKTHITAVIIPNKLNMVCSASAINMLGELTLQFHTVISKQGASWLNEQSLKLIRHLDLSHGRLGSRCFGFGLQSCACSRWV